MRVAIIEIGGSHMENVYTLVHLLQKRECEIILVINEKLVSLVYDKQAIKSIVTVPDDITKFSVQLKEYKRLRLLLKKEKVETVIIGTTEIKPVRTLVFFLPVKNIIGIVHDASKLEKSSTFKNILSLKMKKFIVFGNYILKKLKPLPKYKIASLDVVYFPKVKQMKLIKPANEFWVVIPGTVSGDRRDYLPLIQQLRTNQLPGQLKIILLGYFPASEQSIRTALNNWKEAGKHVISFQEYLGYDLFHSYLNHADIILPLMKLENDSFYADRRTSGSIHLGLGYQKPFLLPSSFKNELVIPFSIYYSSIEELVDQIRKLTEDQSLMERISNNYKIDVSTDLEKQSKELMEFISS